MQVTAQIARAAGQDAGNRSMRAARRTSWNEADWNAAAEVTDRLLAVMRDAATHKLDILA